MTLNWKGSNMANVPSVHRCAKITLLGQSESGKDIHSFGIITELHVSVKALDELMWITKCLLYMEGCIRKIKARAGRFRYKAHLEVGHSPWWQAYWQMMLLE